MTSDTQTALLFPGQGSQTDDMRELVERVAPELIELALAEVGSDPFAQLEDGTRFVQPALYCGSIAAWIAAGRPDATYFAGHSLGEIPALAAAGAYSVSDGVRIAAIRGRLMAEAAARDGVGGMLALIGDSAAARELAAAHGVEVANDNAPGQLVLSGASDALDEIVAAAKPQGLRGVKLRVAGAFHSSAMTSAVPLFREALAEIEIAPTRVPVFSGVTTKPFSDDFRDELASALTNPVRWRETLLALDELGVARYIETGPGKVLRNLVRRTLPDAEATTLAELEAVGA